MSIQRLAAYFAKLGVMGFGGPVALVGAMHRDLVDQHQAFSEEEYRNGLALAQLAPGPLAAQLAIYLGWLRGGVFGAALVGLAFVLPSFLIVVVLAALYVHFGQMTWMQGAFYGVGAAVIAILVRSAHKLTMKTVANDHLLWGIFAVNAVVTAVFEAEYVSLVLGSGLLYLVVKARWRPNATMMIWPVWLVSGLHGAATDSTLGKILLYFTQAGAFVFGSGLAIVPFLHGGVVTQYHWLNEQQFLDAVAVAMLTPGPVVITVAFIGFLVAGPLGAVLAAIGTFVPCYVFTVLPAPHFSKWVKNEKVAAMVRGITVAATGAIVGAVFVLGRRALFDGWTVGIFALAGLVLWRAPKFPEPLVVLAAAVFGILIQEFKP